MTILGSGWGAFRLLKEINPQKYKVTLVSPRNHLLFTPLLSSASVGSVNPASICVPLRPECAARGVCFREAHAEGIDLESKEVHCKSHHGDGYTVKFDKLVVAVGKQANDFNIPGVRKHAFFMKETADASRLREALLTRLEEASCHISRAVGEELSVELEAKVQQLLSVVVVGGGPTSVGFARELVDFIARDVPRIYPHLRNYISLHLVEWASSGQSTQSHVRDQALRDYTLKRLERKPGVQMHHEQVAEASSKSLRLTSGKVIPCGTLVWNAGMKPVSFVQSSALEKCPNGKLLTDGFLRVRGQEDIFAVGDCAEVSMSGLPQTVHVANQQGAYLAKQLNSEVPFTKPFALQGFGALTCAGSGPTSTFLRGSAIREAYGYLAWLSWRSAAFSSQLTMRNRVLIACDRLTKRLFGRCIARLGQDTAALPEGYEGDPSQSPIQPYGCTKVLDQQITSLLNDIGMRQVGGGLLESDLMPNSSLQRDRSLPQTAARNGSMTAHDL